MNNQTQPLQADLGWISECQQMANAIRRRVLGHAVEHGGYLSQACSSAEIFSFLYGRGMHLGASLGPKTPPPFSGAPSSSNPQHTNGALYNGAKTKENDRFFLSPTHYAMTLYATLIESGRLDANGLDQFNTDGSTVEMIGGEHSPGHETNGGSFGQTISQAAGVAWARKRSGDSGKVWVFLSDGECQEGQTWEAIMAMAYHKIDNIQIVVDVNGQQVDGRCDEVMMVDPLDAKFKAFGAEVARVDGHDLRALDEAFQIPHPGRPLVVVADTSPVQGLDMLNERYPNLHYVRFKNEEERARYRQKYLELMKNA